MTAEKPTIFTIGVYGYSEDAFFGSITDNNIDLFIDIRARRGMRGSKYKFVNSKYLQAKLRELDIAYAHLIELAPSKEIRRIQQTVDIENRTGKHKRTVLSEAFIRSYRRDVLNIYKRKPEYKFNAETILAKARQVSQFPCDQSIQRIVLFCVEEHADACHRSLVADAWARQQGVKIEHISG